LASWCFASRQGRRLIGCQILASRLRIPALIVLLPVGFAAGALTEVVNPDQLLGPLFGPLVSLAVAVVLFDSGLGLDLAKLRGHTRRVVRRLIVLGVPVTWAVAAVWPRFCLACPSGRRSCWMPSWSSRGPR
jgi:NhaP-type Na+/H+ or K+/H+ antiporter